MNTRRLQPLLLALLFVFSSVLMTGLSERTEEIGVILVNVKLLEMAADKRIKGLFARADDS